MNKYSEIEKILLKQGKFHISLELDRIKKILELLNNPQKKLKVIHIAGTNGKGSVSAILNRILIEKGYKTGLFTSPHLVKYNERIKINGIEISDDVFYELVIKITNLAEKNEIHLTEFEILTAVMYEYFAREKIDFAVTEVGLGGRFDATNVIEKPILSIITSISFDHTDRLGDTIEKIAFEKAGIIKENCPVVFDKNNLGAEILTKKAKEKASKIYNPNKAKIIFNEKNLIKYGRETFELNLYGKYQAQNAALAICSTNVLKIEKPVLIKALKKVKWSCRFEYIKEKNIIIDGCHNPDGALNLRESLDFYFPDLKKIFVYTSLKNKDYKEIQKNLFNKNDLIYHYDMKDDKFLKSNDIKNLTQSIDINGLKELINSKKQKDLLIICGSLYAIGDILSKIKLCNF
ncbi:bifunctional folylpolyglutamate synthase/dihydrofolate synthase [bacterium]|nr:bifunctional folylpolyglutamate synthase/dihydrofolate synthase [bacterium]